ncbi:MAG: ABC transporter ATP-binding protein [Bacilli bacterium]|nr:ABC transporter ATP-binding protein [Bacilli bacterium]
MTKKDNKEVLLQNKKYFVIKFISSLFIRIFLLLIPIFYSYSIDSITMGNFNQAYIMIIMFFVFFMLYRVTEVINQITYYKLYSALYKTYLKLGLYKTCNNSLYSLSRFSMSEYSNIMSEDFETMSDYYTTLVIRIVEIMETIYIIVYFFTINIMIGYLTLFICLAVLFLLLYFNSIIARTNNERKLRNDKRISLFQELLLSVKEIKGFNILDVAIDRTNKTVDDYVKWNNKLNIDKYNLKQVSLGLINVFEFICLFIGIRLIISGNMTIGVLTIIYSYYTKLGDLFLSIITLFESNINVKVARLRIHKLFQYATVNYGENENATDVKGNIEFKNVLYGNKNHPFLNKVSFKIKEKTINVITGPTGSGKVGIFELLLRYNRQHDGKILIDDVDIKEYDSKTLSNILSSVRRDPTFFNISIKDNLSIFESNFENIISLAKELKIHDYIMSLDNGYDTILETNGSNINTDVKYLLAIMRVFLNRPKIMLFDETFDFLSKDLANGVLDTLKSLKGDNTILIISKSKSIIEMPIVDNVIMLNENKIVATGIHEELLKSNKEYKKIFNKL